MNNLTVSPDTATSAIFYPTLKASLRMPESFGHEESPISGIIYIYRLHKAVHKGAKAANFNSIRKTIDGFFHNFAIKLFR